MYKELYVDTYMRYREVEDQTHIILYKGISEMKQEYLNELKYQLYKVEKLEDEKEIINMIVSDIESFLNRQDQEYIITQYLVGIDLIFKECIMCNQINVNQDLIHSMKN